MWIRIEGLEKKDWDEVIRTNKLLHGFLIRSEVADVVRARHPAFVLQTQDKGDGKPCFQVVDGSTTQVYETTNAFQSSLAENAFSETCIEGEISIGDMGIQAGLSGERSRRKKSSTEESSTIKGHEYHASYNDIEENQTPRSLRDFEVKFGHIFVTSVVLGGQQRTVKLSGALEQMTDHQKEDAVRGALGAKISAPYVTASLQRSKDHGTGSSAKNQEYADLSFISMSANGGDTLVGADIPTWTKTVSAHKNWRVIGNEIAVPISQLIAQIQANFYLPGLFLWIRKGKPKATELLELSEEERIMLHNWLSGHERKNKQTPSELMKKEKHTNKQS
ncbi:hypothetical protein F5Y16DRAFT_155470 [Xylariaceae sp. FL0255]|nr:hypothetical protein F5Y16DRAFT_155470 [Xylariaceae sp. FL0255]